MDVLLFIIEMLWHFLTYTPPEYNVALSPVAAAILGGSAIVSGVANLFGQKSANSSNLKSVRETNEMNYKIAQEQNAANRANLEYQNDWNLDQWNRENLYNSAGAQVARYRQAGIDPAQAMSGQSAGVASSITSENAAPAVGATMQAPMVQPLNYEPLIGSIAQAGNLLYDSMIKSEQAKGMKWDNMLKEFNVSNMRDNFVLETNRKLRELDVLRDRHLLNQKDYELKKQEILFGERSFDLRIDNLKKQNAKIDSDIKSSSEAVERAKEESKRQERAMDIQKLLADANVKVSNAQVAQITKQIEKIDQDMSIDIQKNAREGMDAYIRRLGSQLEHQIKRLTVNGLTMQQAFDTIINSSEIWHNKLKDKSIVNQMAEYFFGIGFKDIGHALSSFGRIGR